MTASAEFALFEATRVLFRKVDAMLTQPRLPRFVLLVMAFAPLSAFAQEKSAPEPKAQEKPAATPKPPEGAGEMSPEMQAAMAAMMPGPAHQKLAKLAGDWTVKAKLTMAGQPPEETEATSRIMVVLEGRFLHEDYSGTMMGMPFRSTHVLGFNNGSKKYEGMWAYSMGTGLMILSGTSPDDGKTIKCDASFDNEVGVRETMTVTYAIADDDHFTVSLGGGKMPDGSPGPTMEMAYTRKK